MTGNPFLPKQRKFYKDDEFMEGANELLREHIYPELHEEARLFMHTGRVCLLRHVLDNHLLMTELDPAGLKLYVAPPGMDRHQFEKDFSNRDFIHPDYFAVVADPVRKKIRLEYAIGGYKGDTIVYYEENVNDFDLATVRAGMAHFSLLLPPLP